MLRLYSTERFFNTSANFGYFRYIRSAIQAFSGFFRYSRSRVRTTTSFVKPSFMNASTGTLSVQPPSRSFLPPSSTNFETYGSDADARI